MKVFFEVTGILFVSVGAVIGAGFISGHELVGFFGAEGFVVPVIIMGVVMFFCTAMLFMLGRRFSRLKTLNGALLKHGKPFSAAVYFSSFISVGGLLAGLDEIWNSFGFLQGAPILSAFMLLILSFVSKKGIKGVERVSVALVPVILVAVNFLIATGSGLSFPSGGGGFLENGVNIILYVSMNCFINLPAIVEVAGGKSRKAAFISAFAVSVVLTVQSLLILGTIANAGSAVAESGMPLLFSLNGKYRGVYAACVLVALATSLVSAYYPLYSFAVGTGKTAGILILAFAEFVFSRLGLKNIVEYAYPLIGAFGTIYIFKCIQFLLKEKRRGKRSASFRHCGIKTLSYADNKVINCSGRSKIMKKKKKGKVIKLTDEQYGEYIMALKDERPPKIVSKTQD